MNRILRFLAYIFSRLLLLYPGSFRKEFADEMELVFRETVMQAAHEGISSLLIVSVRELRGLIIGIVQELRYELGRKGVQMELNEGKNSGTDPGTRNSTIHALLATLPFILFGLTCLLAELASPVSLGNAYLIFSIAVMFGLLIGIATNFPNWTYSYLGWAVVMAFMWSMSWLMLLIAIGIGLLLARSIRPLRQCIHGIGEDWTILSFMMYAFVAFVLLIYDENHHPYLAVFMLGSTLVISLGAWFYLRNTVNWKKLVSLFSGFVFGYIISYVCYATWDWSAYHGFPEAPPQEWYVALRNMIEIVLIWSVFLLWPAIIGLVQLGIKKRKIV
jgi:hypothetical protein